MCYVQGVRLKPERVAPGAQPASDYPGHPFSHLLAVDSEQSECPVKDALRLVARHLTLFWLHVNSQQC